MSKVKALLEKAGCSAELSESICNTLEEYKRTIQEQYNAEYEARISKAKKVCLEETEAHKRELARRVQIFCETKAAAIEAHLAKQSAHRESQATAKLESMKSLLEGIEPNGEHNRRTTVALDKARREIQRLNEERQKAVTVANRQVAISRKTLKENQRLSSEVSRLKNAVMAESRKPKRIDSGRLNGTPTTTRRTLHESQDRRSVPNRIPYQQSSSYGISEIAATLDEDLV